MSEILEREEVQEIDAQLAENNDVDTYEDEDENEYKKKRELLAKTKITKQIWSVLELYDKIQTDKTIILDPDYQRGDVWKDDKRTAFIESLFMGIVVPPIYVVEIPKKSKLEKVKYEVVDGKQRLTSILKFINGELKLKSKSLEYYSDWFSNKNFEEISEDYSEEVDVFLSQVLDVYVITSTSPEFTKYDIFSRLNKGAAPLRVNEIRRAAYHSDLLIKISEFVSEKQKNKEEYKAIFSDLEIKHFEDLGKFYRAIGMYIQSNLEKCVVESYNSRPREMINNVLEKFQTGDLKLSDSEIEMVLNRTYEVLKYFKGNNSNYYLDAVIKIYSQDQELGVEFLDRINDSQEIKDTFNQSPSTTTNVNKRLKFAVDIWKLEKGKMNV